jgi:hypothetical protein
MNLRTATRLHCCLAQPIFLLFCCLRAGPQDNVATQVANYPFLLRLEHTTHSSKTCVLLRRNGEFHLERTRSGRTLVSEGRIPESEMQKLKGILDSDELQKISQQKIVPPLLYPLNDQLQVNVFRKDHWQNLLFPESTSQMPFRQTLKPLVTWLNALHYGPHRELSEEEGVNNCLPPEKPELKIRTNESSASSAGETTEATPSAVKPQSSQPDLFLMRYSRDRISDGNLDRTCVIVNSAGFYRMEKGNQPATFKMKTTVFEGSVMDGELQELRQIHDAPDLKNLHHKNHIPSMTVRDADVISVSIPRDNETQELVFSGYVAVRSHGKGAPSSVTDDTSSIEPIQKWFETLLESKDLAPMKSAHANNCAAVP